MGLFDKLKDVADKAKSAIDDAKSAQEAKKAAQEQHRLEMEGLAAEKAKEVVNNVLGGSTGAGFLSKIGKDDLLTFTKEFYDKILLPAHSVNKSRITMYPYITDKQIAKLSQTWTDYNRDETALILLKSINNQEILITDRNLYFSLALVEDVKFLSRGKVPCESISKVSTAKSENSSEFKCNDVVLASFANDKAVLEDFVSLNNYFECIEKQDFVITDEEVDALIREKIGEKVYAEVKKYLVYDDEQLVYFAWGINSLSAKDYIVCTNKQILIVDREVLGATVDIRQFYYEDITSASTLQNTKSNDLLVDLVATAIVSATQTCTLVLTVAGSTIRIDTLFKVEAERVVAVYHQFRKAAKMNAAQPQVVVQQAPAQSDPFEQLQKLQQMKEMGIISEAEFNEKKTELLSKI